MGKSFLFFITGGHRKCNNNNMITTSKQEQTPLAGDRTTTNKTKQAGLDRAYLPGA